MHEIVLRFIWQDVEALTAALIRTVAAGALVFSVAAVVVTAVVIVVNIVAAWREARSPSAPRPRLAVWTIRDLIDVGITTRTRAPGRPRSAISERLR